MAWGGTVFVLVQVGRYQSPGEPLPFLSRRGFFFILRNMGISRELCQHLFHRRPAQSDEGQGHVGKSSTPR